MIEPQLMSEEAWSFILANENADIPSLVLKHQTVGGIPIADIADQISGRRKARIKLAHYYAEKGILYPPSLNLEQTSSEETARYKAILLKALSSEEFTITTVADLTGGFGIDTFAFAKRFEHVIHIEPDKALQDLARYNHEVLGARNISYANQSAEEFLSTSSPISLIYADPSRRRGSQKVYSLNDCQPDITVLHEQIFRCTEWFLLKASPMLDIAQTIGQLPHVMRVFVVAVENEVKELLFLARRGFAGEATIFAINRSEDSTSSVQFSVTEEHAAQPAFSEPMAYVYEPNVALLKAGAFKLTSNRYSVNKLHENTHLYTSDNLEWSFPGRIFRVVSPLKADRGSVNIFFPEGKANVITRNYPVTPEGLKKKLKLGDGGERYLLAFTTASGPRLAAAERLK